MYRAYLASVDTWEGTFLLTFLPLDMTLHTYNVHAIRLPLLWMQGLLTNNSGMGWMQGNHICTVLINLASVDSQEGTIPHWPSCMDKSFHWATFEFISRRWTHSTVGKLGNKIMIIAPPPPPPPPPPHTHTHNICRQYWARLHLATGYMEWIKYGHINQSTPVPCSPVATKEQLTTVN